MKYFTIAELSNSATAKKRGLDNTPSQAVVANLTKLVDNVLDPLREAWGRPITVSSGYRSPNLNVAVGGVKNSQHVQGQAADLVVGGKADNYKLFQLAISLKLPYDQIIWEKSGSSTWVHISHTDMPRKQILPASEAKKLKA
jgi:uncharacterized protein YcbK (DUF882 family)